MKYEWEDLPKPINAFTTRNTVMMNLNTGKVVQYYGANTKIVLVQKKTTPKGTYYRTRSAEHHSLNWAFEASAFGLPNEKAPSEPSMFPPKIDSQLETSTPTLVKKQKRNTKVAAPIDGGGQHKNWFKKLFRRLK